MAVVYKAYDTRLEREVAVKVIRTEEILPSALKRTRKRFEREAKALARLDHGNIISIIDYGEEEGIPYLVMVYIQGGTLKERLKKKPVPWEKAAQFLAPIARALNYAHKQGIVHRDIKPSNILITKKDQPMLTDFGIARILKTEETLDLTGTGMGVGTPEYMAPEQGLGHKVDHRADIYALGIIFYEMVTGRKPFQADTPMAVVIKQINDPLPRPTQFVPDLPKVVENILLKALAKDPKNRYQTMGELAIAFERLILEFEKGNKRLEGQKEKNELIQRKKEEKEKRKEEEKKKNYALQLKKQEEKRKIRQLQKEKRQKAKSQRPPGKKAPIVKLVAGIFGLLIVSAVSWFGFSGAFGILTSEATVVDNPTDILTFKPVPLVTIIPSPLVEPTSTTPENTLAATSSPEATATPELGIGSEMTSEIDGMVQLYVPEGPFTMGSDEAHHFVVEQIIDVEAFWVDETEITNAMYDLCVTAGTCPPPSDNSSRKRESYYGNSRYGDFPVVYITYSDAQSYCEWAGRHLPSMIEWEKAARGTDGRTYPWGEFSPADNNSSLLNFNYLIGDTLKVGSYPKGASPYGVLDIVGNVAEFVIISNQIILAEGQTIEHLELNRIAVGGYFNSNRDEVRTNNTALDISKTDSNYYVGFRCVHDVTP